MGTEYINTDRRAFLNTRKSASCAHKLDYHFVFATKFRRPVLVGAVSDALRDILVAACAERKWLLLSISVQADHIHVIVGLRPEDAPSQVAHDLKGLSSFRLIGAFPQITESLSSTKLWGRGYSVETLGRSNVAQINAYLQTQEAHHAENGIDAS